MFADVAGISQKAVIFIRFLISGTILSLEWCKIAQLVYSLKDVAQLRGGRCIKLHARGGATFVDTGVLTRIIANQFCLFS